MSISRRSAIHFIADDPAKIADGLPLVAVAPPQDFPAVLIEITKPGHGLTVRAKHRDATSVAAKHNVAADLAASFTKPLFDERKGLAGVIGHRKSLGEGRRFEREILVGKDYVQPDYPEGDLDAGAEAALQLMMLGTPLIYQGVLKTDRLVGVPDLLVKKSGKSNLGGWSYEPSEIKISKSVQTRALWRVPSRSSLINPG